MLAALAVPVLGQLEAEEVAKTDLPLELERRHRAVLAQSAKARSEMPSEWCRRFAEQSQHQHHCPRAESHRQLVVPHCLLP